MVFRNSMRAVWVAGCLSWMVAGCGDSSSPESVCSKVEKALKSLGEKGDACLDGETEERLERRQKALSSCEETYTELTESEQNDVLEDAEDLSSCIDALETCEEDDGDSWSEKVERCFDRSEDLVNLELATECQRLAKRYVEKTTTCGVAATDLEGADLESCPQSQLEVLRKMLPCFERASCTSIRNKEWIHTCEGWANESPSKSEEPSDTEEPN